MREDLINRRAAISAVNTALFPKINTAKDAEKALLNLPAAQPEPPWIPCNEKMPENEATVLVTVAFPSGVMPKVLEMSYSNGRWYRHDMLVSPWWAVVAWRPMPKPYFEGVLCGWAFEKEWEEQNGSEVQ